MCVDDKDMGTESMVLDDTGRGIICAQGYVNGETCQKKQDEFYYVLADNGQISIVDECADL